MDQPLGEKIGLCNCPTNIWQVARWNIPGLMAHQSAMEGGKIMDVTDLGDPPADWEVLDWKR